MCLYNCLCTNLQWQLRKWTLESDCLAIGCMTYIVCDLEQIFKLYVPWLPICEMGMMAVHPCQVVVRLDQVKYLARRLAHPHYKFTLAFIIVAPPSLDCKCWCQIHVSHSSSPRLPSPSHPCSLIPVLIDQSFRLTPHQWFSTQAVVKIGSGASGRMKLRISRVCCSIQISKWSVSPQTRYCVGMVEDVSSALWQLAQCGKQWIWGRVKEAE